ncbi:unnamed protein product [Spirodela intermedia]|uniref:Uncharacterized protein n=1 Tax=Spirodela intermedia TaxID=51605 RepID=A0A7I8KT05_SPIIN|nr:unnamed protein product [Spirodela intermedia]
MVSIIFIIISINIINFIIFNRLWDHHTIACCRQKQNPVFLPENLLIVPEQLERDSHNQNQR